MMEIIKRSVREIVFLEHFASKRCHRFCKQRLVSTQQNDPNKLSELESLAKTKAAEWFAWKECPSFWNWNSSNFGDSWTSTSTNDVIKIINHGLLISIDYDTSPLFCIWLSALGYSSEYRHEAEEKHEIPDGRHEF